MLVLAVSVFVTAMAAASLIQHSGEAFGLILTR